MYASTTRLITVKVQPIFLREQSDPDESRYVWAYRVTIENGGDEVVQLLRRHWQITDGIGRLQEVSGLGVVGEQPTLKPGETFEYTSSCPLSTPSGLMTGTYQMVNETGEHFDIAIPMFSLDSPDQAIRLN